MYRQFEFEGDIHASLDCVPMAARRKLDLARLKISLAGWQALPRADRLSLCHLPVDGDGDLAVYIEVLRDFAARAGVELKPLPPPDFRWRAPTMPEELVSKFRDSSVSFEAARWETLGEDERYAVMKYADPKREPAKLLLAALEVGLAQGTTPTSSPLVACGTVTPA